VWFVYTVPPLAGSTLTLDTTDCDTDFDTVLTVLTGNALGNLTLEIQNDECDAYTSKSCLDVSVRPNQVLYVRVSGYDDNSQGRSVGTVKLRWSYCTFAGTVAMIPVAVTVAACTPVCLTLLTTPPCSYLQLAALPARRRPPCLPRLPFHRLQQHLAPTPSAAVCP
jgi:hypothetical protein